MGEQFIYNDEVIYDSTEKQPQNNFFKRLKKLFKNPVSFITVFTAIALVLAGINGIIKYLYYGIGWSLFSYDPSWVFPKILGFLIVWLILIGIPIANFRSFLGDDKKTKFAKFILYLIIYCGFIVKYGDLITYYFKNSTPDFIPKWIALVMFAIGLYTDFFTIPKFIYERISKNYKLFNFDSSRKSDFRLAFLVFKVVCVIFSGIIFIFITSLNLIGYEQPTNTKTYVTTVINNEEKIVLFQSNDKLFLADFTVDENKDCIIFTKKYSIVEAIGHDYQNLKVRKVTVKKDEEKPENEESNVLNNIEEKPKPS